MDLLRDSVLERKSGQPDYGEMADGLSREYSFQKNQTTVYDAFCRGATDPQRLARVQGGRFERIFVCY